MSKDTVGGFFVDCVGMHEELQMLSPNITDRDATVRFIIMVHGLSNLMNELVTTGGGRMVYLDRDWIYLAVIKDPEFEEVMASGWAIARIKVEDESSEEWRAATKKTMAELGFKLNMGELLHKTTICGGGS